MRNPFPGAGNQFPNLHGKTDGNTGNLAKSLGIMVAIERCKPFEVNRVFKPTKERKMNVKVKLYSALLALALTVSFSPNPARGAEAPRDAKHCQSIAVDLTDPAMVALLQKLNEVRPASTIRVEERGEGAERTRVAAQDFESTTPDNPAPVKTTVTCTSGTCLGLNCAVVGCDPATINGQTACTPCNCVPVPPAITCSTNSCTCTKVTTQTPGTATPTGSESTPEP